MPPAQFEVAELARKRDESLLEDLLKLAAGMPWQVSAAVAVISFFVFHHFATLPPPKPVVAHPGQVGQAVSQGLWHALIVGFSMLLQYVVPAVFLAGAGVSAYRRRKAAKLHADVRADPTPDALTRLSPVDFERLVGEAFRRKGFLVRERGGNGPDGGVDVELHMGRDKYLVQCKRWRTRQVGVATVRELFGVMTAEGAVGGYVVASGNFTEEAKAFAEGRAIELVPSESLLALIQAGPSGTPGDRKEPTVSPPAEPEGPTATEANPSCPQCGTAMRLGKAKTGAQAGKRFWVCPGYPKCPGVVPARE